MRSYAWKLEREYRHRERVVGKAAIAAIKTGNSVEIHRDILGVVILRARAAGLPVVFHIHDEIIVEAPRDRTLEEVEALFSQPIDWCRELPLKGAGYSTPYYLKD